MRDDECRAVESSCRGVCQILIFQHVPGFCRDVSDSYFIQNLDKGGVALLPSRLSENQGEEQSPDHTFENLLPHYRRKLKQIPKSHDTHVSERLPVVTNSPK